MTVQRTIYCAGHEKPLKRTNLLAQQRLVGDLLLYCAPLVKGKNHQVPVPVSYYQAVIFLFGKHFTKSGGENDPSFVIYCMVMLAPED
jgi:hypothetical protein